MNIFYIDHARERMVERGASEEEEVRSTLLSGKQTPAQVGRRAKEHDFQYNSEWQGRRYEQKKLRVIYAEEGERLVVITVYVYYGRWEDV